MSRKIPDPREGHHRPGKGRLTLRATLAIAAALSVIATVALVEDTRVAAKTKTGGAVQAGESRGPQGAPTIVGTDITWTADMEFESALLVVVGRSEPRTVKQVSFSARDALHLDVARAGLADGRYKYELLLYPPSRGSGRSSAATERVTVRSGVFLVRDGIPVTPRDLDQQRTQAPRGGGGRH